MWLSVKILRKELEIYWKFFLYIYIKLKVGICILKSINCFWNFGMLWDI